MASQYVGGGFSVNSWISCNYLTIVKIDKRIGVFENTKKNIDEKQLEKYL